MRTGTDAAIRTGVASDGPFIRELAGEAFTEYSLAAQRGILRMAAQGATLVAVIDGRRVGFAIVEFSSSSSAHLTAIAVVERERGRGIGERLLDAVERMVHARGVRSLMLVTAESNLAALDLFVRRGFVRADNLPEYYARGQNAVRLTKGLR